MNYTYATIVIGNEDREQAQADLGSGFFNTGLSQSGEAPATHWLSSGPFDNTELNIIVNKMKPVTTETGTTYEPITWNYVISFGQDWQGFINTLDLKMVVLSEESSV